MGTARQREQAETAYERAKAVKAMTDLICICGLQCRCGARERLRAIERSKRDDASRPDGPQPECWRSSQ